MAHSEIGIKVTMTEKALRRRFINGQNVPDEAIVACVPSHAQGKAGMLLEEMVTRREAGWAKYGGRGTYHITDVEAAIEFIEDNGGNVPYNIRD